MNTNRRYALPLLLGLAAGGVGLAAAPAASTAEPVSCEIRAEAMNGMISLQGVVHAAVPTSGSYQFRVTNAGSNISQGGGFTAGPGQPTLLGQVMLGGGGLYDAKLTVMANGVTVACDERIGGAI